ncbi:T6SS amidase immunity protein Tai4 family protein [Cronobacter dublinensis]|uniref:T6SS amidase immunity protein Tai4 family protein n=1 Tax=Cronobacter dublinensis TaxID=413497 RepID=UPI0003A93D25|nr:T6SS amidase immunity protein Tai4 family protein [Cronobacter dublinensis]MDI6427189.1 T6SS amidase immunity protein Tai4 family protein [Cronobacter dublinensis]
MLKTSIAALSVLTFSFHAALAQPLAPISEFTQPQIFTQWVQSRCIASIADSAALKADANASAAAWLEASELPVEAFNAADAVIAQALKTRVGGTAKTDYRVLKCALIAQSADVRALYQQFARQKAQ